MCASNIFVAEVEPGVIAFAVKSIAPGFVEKGIAKKMKCEDALHPISATNSKITLCPDLTLLRTPWSLECDYGHPYSAVPAYFALRALQFEHDARYCFGIMPDCESFEHFAANDLCFYGLELLDRAVVYWVYVVSKLALRSSFPAHRAQYLGALCQEAEEQALRVLNLYSLLLFLSNGDPDTFKRLPPLLQPVAC